MARGSVASEFLVVEPNEAGARPEYAHDLRHTYASWAVAGGASLPILGRQLGHTQPQTTQRYAHLADDPVRAVAQSTGEALARAMGSKSS